MTPSAPEGGANELAEGVGRTAPVCDALSSGLLDDSLEFLLPCASRKLPYQWTQRTREPRRRPLFFFALALIGSNPGVLPAELARLLARDGVKNVADAVGVDVP